MRWLIAVLALALAACGTASKRDAASSARAAGGYYKDDGPGARPPVDLDALPDAVPRLEPLHRYANRPYQVFGRDYLPLTQLTALRERGAATWYGRRYHGGKTSSGEIYDMYAMSAAHPRLPIPSYARVTHLANGRSVVVRINDRGPFHAGRVIDLSYAAAHRLDLLQAGSAQVEVEAIVPGPAPLAASPITPPAAATAAPPAGIYLQLGAFAARDNAESFAARAQRAMHWMAQPLHIVGDAALHRVQSGPYESREAAGAAADRVRGEFDVAPIVVVR